MKTLFVAALTAIAIATGGVAASAAPADGYIMVHGYTTDYGR